MIYRHVPGPRGGDQGWGRTRRFETTDESFLWSTVAEGYSSKRSDEETGALRSIGLFFRSVQFSAPPELTRAPVPGQGRRRLSELCFQLRNPRVQGRDRFGDLLGRETRSDIFRAVPIKAD